MYFIFIQKMSLNIVVSGIWNSHFVGKIMWWVLVQNNGMFLPGSKATRVIQISYCSFLRISLINF